MGYDRYTRGNNEFNELMMDRHYQQYSDDEINIKDLLFAILSYRWLVISSFLLFTLIGILYCRYTVDTYSTKATLLISEDQSTPSSFINDNEYQFLFNENRNGEDNISIFKSTLVLNNVVETLGLTYEYSRKQAFHEDEVLMKNTLPFNLSFKDEMVNQQCVLRYTNNLVVIEINDKSFTFPKSEMKFENSVFLYRKLIATNLGVDSYLIHHYTMNEAVERLKSNYSVSQSNESNSYEISYSGPNKKLNLYILRGIVDGIQHNNLIEKQSIYQMAIDYIDVRMLDLSQKIDSLNFVISNFKVENNVFMPESQTNAVLTNLDEIEMKIFNNILQSELSTKLLHDLAQQESFNLLPNDLGIENVNINQMVFEFNKIILEKNNLIDATEKNPLVVQLQNQLIDLRTNILNSVRIYKSKLEMKLARYNEYRNTNNSLAGAIPMREAELGNLERDIMVVNNLYSFLSQKRVEAAISLSSLETNIKLINEVGYDFVRTSNKSGHLALFSFLGFMLPAGFSLIKYFIRQSMVDADFLKEKVGSDRFLGVLRYIKDSNAEEKGLIQHELLSRIYHNMRLKNFDLEKGNTIMITSCIKNEGKTFTAYNFSKYLSSLDKKVVLLGLDLWNPDLYQHFNADPKAEGLKNVLNSFIGTFEKTKISEDNLDVLLTGTDKTEWNSFIDHENFNKLISYLKRSYDYIVFDTAPLQMKVDSLKLLEKSDFILHVFRKNYSQKKCVQDALEYQKKYCLEGVGYVMIDDSKPDKLLNKYGYGYGNGHGYGMA